MGPVQLTADRRTRLRVYLNDHLAAATGAIRVAERCRRSNQGTPLAEFLERFVAELHEDRAALRGLLARLGLPVAKPKELLAVAAELAGRAKLNGQLRGYSPLARLLELEGLCVGVDAKRCLWLSLVEVADVEPAVRELDLGSLLQRAQRQRQDLERERRAAAMLALADRSPPAGRVE